MRWQSHEIDMTDQVPTEPPTLEPLSERLFTHAMAEAGREKGHVHDSALWQMGIHARYYEALIDGLTRRLDEYESGRAVQATEA